LACARLCPGFWNHVPNLVRCTVDFGDSPDTLDDLDHSSLESLHLILRFHKFYLDVLFNNLTLRALQDLDIAGPLGAKQTPALPQNAVASMLNRSSCNLQRLRLFCIRFCSHELIEILQAQPSLVELVIYEPTSPIVTKPVLERMTHDISQSFSTGSPLVIPIQNGWSFLLVFAFGDQVILNLIRSRWRCDLLQVAGLELVKLGITREVSSEMIAQMALWASGRKKG